MKKCLLPLFLLISFSIFAQSEARYANGTDENPRWIQLMYSETPDAGKVTEAYSKYYQTHPFVKNKHTQYYKRWLRSISRTTSLPSREYLKATSKNVKSSSAWEPRGPFDFDIDAQLDQIFPEYKNSAFKPPHLLYGGTLTYIHYAYTNEDSVGPRLVNELRKRWANRACGGDFCVCGLL